MIYSADFHELNVKTIVIFTKSGKMGLSHFVTALFCVHKRGECLTLFTKHYAYYIAGNHVLMAHFREIEFYKG